MWKVTDVCDPKDCPTPLDIKVEPYKVGGRGRAGQVGLAAYIL
jgi:hypothetical protein